MSICVLNCSRDTALMLGANDSPVRVLEPWQLGKLMEMGAFIVVRSPGHPDLFWKVDHDARRSA